MKFTGACIAALAALTVSSHAAELRLTGPYVRDNLSIYLVHGSDRVHTKYLTLSEGLAQNKVVVYETGDVNQLQVENLSKDDVYIQSGEIVKGGKQDRVLKDDIILPTKSGKVTVAAFCVEHGRWTQRGKEESKSFAAAPNAISSPKLKAAVRDAKQNEVWSQVAAAQDKLANNLKSRVKSAESESSYQLTLESPKLRETVAAFKQELAGLPARFPDSLGYVVAVNGEVTGSDVYAGHELFLKLWPKLLESVVVEAIAAGKPGEKFAAAPMDEVRQAATGNGAKVVADGKVNSRTGAVKADLPQGTVFETRDSDSAGAGPVHRSYMKKQ